MKLQTEVNEIVVNGEYYRRGRWHPMNERQPAWGLDGNGDIAFTAAKRMRVTGILLYGPSSETDLASIVVDMPEAARGSKVTIRLAGIRLVP